MRTDNELLRECDDGLDGARGIVWTLVGFVLPAILIGYAWAT